MFIYISYKNICIRSDLAGRVAGPQEMETKTSCKKYYFFIKHQINLLHLSYTHYTMCECDANLSKRGASASG